MSETRPREPVLLEVYERFLRTRDTVGFVHAISDRYTSSTLDHLTRHPDCRLRRAAVFALGFVGDFQLNHSIGMAMQDEDRIVRLLAEKACRRVWNRVGSKEQRRALTGIIRANAACRYRDAIDRASALLEDAPDFAEAWYQRGAARFQLEDYADSIADWHQALELNAYHFVAAAAMGEAFIRLDDGVSALEAFRRAVQLNPDLDKVQERIQKLQRDQ